MSTPLNTIFSWFEEGDVPTTDQFQQTFSSFRHLDEKIKMDDVTGLNEALKALSTPTSTGHPEDQNAHSSVLAKLNASNLTPANVEQWREKLNIGLMATIDGTETTGNVYTKLQIGAIMSGLQAKDEELLGHIKKIDDLLVSDDINLDKLQEVVDYIKENREQIKLVQQAIANGSSDDKLRLLGNYSSWGTATFQNQFNDLAFGKIKNIENEIASEKITYEQRVRGDSVIKHDLNTLSFVMDAYDTVTMFTVPLKVRRINTNTIEVLFDSVPPNIIQLTIKKL